MDSTASPLPASFNRWRLAFGALLSPALRCESEPPQILPTWESGAIMTSVTHPEEKSEKELKQDARECKRCEKWRDDLVKESKLDLL